MRFLLSKKYSPVLLFVLGVFVGFLAGYKGGALKVEAAISNTLEPIKQFGTQYSFVHPLLAYRTPEAVDFGEYDSLKSEYLSMSRAAESAGVRRLSIYFRDLEIGRWVGLNQDDMYYPASLLKVPTMIAFYKKAEENPYLLKNTVVYDPGVAPAGQYLATSTLNAWQTYTIQDLVGHMITDSDNGATFTLLNHIDWDYLNGVYAALGIPDPGDNSEDYKISARMQALFFRVLYNGTYLSSEYSERALKLLAETTYTSGIVAGVPHGIPVAHKYGEHVLADGGAVQGVELSDCGIVYYPRHPYALCVMTSAVDVPSAERVIAQVSSITYDVVEKQYSND